MKRRAEDGPVSSRTRSRVTPVTGSHMTANLAPEQMAEGISRVLARRHESREAALGLVLNRPRDYQTKWARADVMDYVNLKGSGLTDSEPSNTERRLMDPNYHTSKGAFIGRIMHTALGTRTPRVYDDDDKDTEYHDIENYFKSRTHWKETSFHGDFHPANPHNSFNRHQYGKYDNLYGKSDWKYREYGDGHPDGFRRQSKTEAKQALERHRAVREANARINPYSYPDTHSRAEERFTAEYTDPSNLYRRFAGLEPLS